VARPTGLLFCQARQIDGSAHAADGVRQCLGLMSVIVQVWRIAKQADTPRGRIIERWKVTLGP
jgi:hypothetical protein